MIEKTTDLSSHADSLPEGRGAGGTNHELLLTFHYNPKSDHTYHITYDTICFEPREIRLQGGANREHLQAHTHFSMFASR